MFSIKVKVIQLLLAEFVSRKETVVSQIGPELSFELTVCGGKTKNKSLVLVFMKKF